MTPQIRKLTFATFFLTASSLILIFAKTISRQTGIDLIGLRAASVATILYSLYKLFSLLFLSTTTKNNLSRLIAIGGIILFISLITLSVIFATNNLWRFCLILYFILSITSLILQQLQQNKKFTFSNVNLRITIIVWFISIVAVWLVGDRLFNSPFDFFDYNWRWESIYPLAIIALFVFFFKYNKLVGRIGYISATICLSSCGLIYFSIANVHAIVLFYIFMMSAIASLPIFTYICIKNYPNLEGTLAVIVIMLIIKSIDTCTQLFDIQSIVKALP